METFKKALAFLLYGSVVWLAWVFGGQVGVTGMAGLILALLILSLGAWIWGNWGSLRKAKKTRRVAGLVCAVVFGFALFLEYFSSSLTSTEVVSSSEQITHDPTKIAWKKWSTEAVHQGLADGKTVYVDFTATWCLTCQVNKKVALGNKEVITFFKDNEVIALKGDWTRKDPKIKEEIGKFGRVGVPTNIIYRPDGSSQLLPEVLTPGIVLEALKKESKG